MDFILAMNSGEEIRTLNALLDPTLVAGEPEQSGNSHGNTELSDGNVTNMPLGWQSIPPLVTRAQRAPQK
jgi:hypothetical protein